MDVSYQSEQNYKFFEKQGLILEKCHCEIQLSFYSSTGSIAQIQLSFYSNMGSRAILSYSCFKFLTFEVESEVKIEVRYIQRLAPSLKMILTLSLSNTESSVFSTSGPLKPNMVSSVAVFQFKINRPVFKFEYVCEAHK